MNFAKSNQLIEWDDEAETLLDFAEKNNIPMNSACRVGGCGTCSTAIREGEVEYLKEPECEVEDGCCLTCISVPAKNLTIDK